MYTYGIVKVETYSYNKRVISSKCSCIDSFFIPANTQRLGTQRQALCIAVHSHLHLQHLTPRQPLRFTHL